MMLNRFKTFCKVCRKEVPWDRHVYCSNWCEENARLIEYSKAWRKYQKRKEESNGDLRQVR